MALAKQGFINKDLIEAFKRTKNTIQQFNTVQSTKINMRINSAGVNIPAIVTKVYPPKPPTPQQLQMWKGKSFTPSTGVQITIMAFDDVDPAFKNEDGTVNLPKRKKKQPQNAPVGQQQQQQQNVPANQQQQQQQPQFQQQQYQGQPQFQQQQQQQNGKQPFQNYPQQNQAMGQNQQRNQQFQPQPPPQNQLQIQPLQQQNQPQQQQPNQSGNVIIEEPHEQVVDIHPDEQDKDYEVTNAFERIRPYSKITVYTQNPGGVAVGDDVKITDVTALESINPKTNKPSILYQAGKIDVIRGIYSSMKYKFMSSVGLKTSVLEQVTQKFNENVPFSRYIPEPKTLHIEFPINYGLLEEENGHMYTPLWRSDNDMWMRESTDKDTNQKSVLPFLKLEGSFETWKGSKTWTQESAKRAYVRVVCYEEALIPFNIKNGMSFAIFGPSLLPFTPMLIVGLVDIRESNMLGLNSITDPQNKYEYGLCMIGSHIIPDIVAGILNVGFPVTRAFVKTVYIDNDVRSREFLRNQDNQDVICLDEYSGNIQALMDNSKVIFRAVTNCQITDRFLRLVKELNEEDCSKYLLNPVMDLESAFEKGNTLRDMAPTSRQSSLGYHTFAIYLDRIDPSTLDSEKKKFITMLISGGNKKANPTPDINNNVPAPQKQPQLAITDGTLVNQSTSPAINAAAVSPIVTSNSNPVQQQQQKVKMPKIDENDSENDAPKFSLGDINMYADDQQIQQKKQAENKKKRVSSLEQLTKESNEDSETGESETEKKPEKKKKKQVTSESEDDNSEGEVQQKASSKKKGAKKPKHKHT